MDKQTLKYYDSNWKELAEKYNLAGEADPLKCPECDGEMYILSFIDNEDVIYKILKHTRAKGRCMCADRRRHRAEAPEHRGATARRSPGESLKNKTIRSAAGGGAGRGGWGFAE